MISGYNNWGRVRDYRKMWEGKEGEGSEGNWQQEFLRLIPQKELYQDRFIILSDGFYDSDFKILKKLVKASAETLENFHTQLQDQINLPEGRIKMLLALAQLTLEELASSEGELLIAKAFDNVELAF